MSQFETIELPLTTIGNKQFLAYKDYYQCEGIKEFVHTFSHCFNRDNAACVGLVGWLFYPEGVPTNK